MPEKTEQEMTRISVRVPIETRDMVYGWAVKAGVRPSHFLSMAIIIGSRSLARVLMPEEFTNMEIMMMAAKELMKEQPDEKILAMMDRMTERGVVGKIMEEMSDTLLAVKAANDDDIEE